MKRLILLAALILLAKLILRAEDKPPDAPALKPAVRVRVPISQPFLRKRNLVLFALDAAAISADGYTTQRAFDLGWREVNPIAQPFGKSRTATAGLGALGLAATVWGSWEAHRRGWRRLEWLVPLAVAGAEVGVSLHNARLGVRGASQTPAPGILVGFPLGGK